jgi:DNA mismatch repair protein MutL
MSDTPAERRPIAILDAALVGRIAAGEVIDRPGAAVRELVDNALDADARLVQIELRGAGLDLIRVADDGRGIEPSELALAFEHHSTSKLRSLEELADLSSFGFRGEALPSIAAVAEVEIASAVDGATAGGRAVVRDGRVVEHGRAARDRGTTVWVRGLFASLPARLRFLKEPRAEVAAVARRVKWFAVAHPSVRFELIIDGRLHFRSSGSGRLDTAVAEAQGDDVSTRLASLSCRQVVGYQVEGLITVGGLTRPSRQHLAVFVNRRRVRVAALDAALEAGYSGLLPAGRHPVGAIFVQAPAGMVDANVHPSKEQVRLRDEAGLAEGLQAMVRALVGASPSEPDRLEGYVLGQPTFTPGRVAEEAALWESGPSGPPLPRYLGQLHASLLLCEGRQGLLLVDQHRAHERVVFERLKQAGSISASQNLLEPTIVEVTAARAPLVESRLAELNALGFGYERFGDHAYRLTSAPLLPDSGDPSASSGEALLAFAAEALAVAGERDDFWRERLLAAVACRSAVKKGRPLPAVRAMALVEDLFHASEPTTCPHGSPVLLQLSRPFLRRQFRW